MQLSEHFRSEEFVCPCCGAATAAPALIGALEDLRAIIGLPITIASGYRCVGHNLAVGGARDSQHVQGHAADIVVPGVPPVVLAMAALEVPAFAHGGIGFGPTICHLDVRGFPARWGYGPRGEKVSWRMAIEAACLTTETVTATHNQEGHTEA
jgi:hypothetical protein